MCKWINNNTFLAISDFVDKRFLDNFAFGRLRTSSEDFGLLRKTSDFFGNDCVVCNNPRTPKIKISRLYLRKSWQVYAYISEKVGRYISTWEELHFAEAAAISDANVGDQTIWHNSLIGIDMLPVFHGTWNSCGFCKISHLLDESAWEPPWIWCDEVKFSGSTLLRILCYHVSCKIVFK